MSQFKTKLPFDLEGAKKLLPKGSVIEGYHWTGSEVELLWRNPSLDTPYTSRLDFPRELLKGKKLPDKVTFKEPTAVHAPTQADPMGLSRRSDELEK